MLGSVHSASPASAPPGTTCSTPLGRPASSKMRAMMMPPRDRRARIGLVHDRVAERQRRRDRADRQDEREVERRDHADDAVRHALGIVACRPSIDGQHQPLRLRCAAAAAWRMNSAPCSISMPALGWIEPVSRMIQPMSSAPFCSSRSAALVEDARPARSAALGPGRLRGAGCGGGAGQCRRRHRCRPTRAPRRSRDRVTSIDAGSGRLPVAEKALPCQRATSRNSGSDARSWLLL